MSQQNQVQSKLNLVLLPSITSENKDVTKWWVHKDSLRLSPLGFEVFTTELDLRSYSFHFEPSITASLKVFLALTKRMTCPYFIKYHNSRDCQYQIEDLYLFGERESVLLQLYALDLKTFIESI